MPRQKNLPNKRHIGKQDPYCTLKLHSDTKRTKAVKRGGQHPEWDEEIRFDLFEDIEDELARTARHGASSPPAPPPKDQHKDRKVKGGKKMRLLCYADDPREPELIGETMVDLTEVLTKGETDEWFTLMNKDKYSGEVYLELTFWSNDKPPEKPHSARPSTLNPQYGGPGSFTPSGGEASAQPGHTNSSGSSPAGGNRVSLHGRNSSAVDAPLPSNSSLANVRPYVPPYDREPLHHTRKYDPSMEFGDASRRRDSYPPHNAPQSSFVYQSATSAYGQAAIANPYDPNHVNVPTADPYASTPTPSTFYPPQQPQFGGSVFGQQGPGMVSSGFAPPQPAMTPQPSGFQPMFSGFNAPRPAATPVPNFIPPPSAMGFHGYPNQPIYPSPTPVPPQNHQIPPFQHQPHSFPSALPPAHTGIVPPAPPASAPPVQPYGVAPQPTPAPFAQQPINQGGRPLPDQPQQGPLTFPNAMPYNHNQPLVQSPTTAHPSPLTQPPAVSSGFVPPPPPPPIQTHRSSSLPVPGATNAPPMASPVNGYAANQPFAAPPQQQQQQANGGTISAHNTGGSSGRAGLPLPPLPNPPVGGGQMQQPQMQSAFYTGAPVPNAAGLPGPPPPLPKPPVGASQAPYAANATNFTPQQQQPYQGGQQGPWLQQPPQATGFANGGFGQPSHTPVPQAGVYPPPPQVQTPWH
ncbi:SubName: Full=Uncharacterized protein {ECO:0000313/EMBL:CCA74969.1} [Serendipita indica DSM 11827]|uniref:C2 domain-containing protein n=1 Tax=Serendipita indica (strain DSM 11827) TaxID=1109443 RepID=G4TUH6_SERID|nr:SubName: Full=Uncharacterized protein {ECO:0000313/EMBL:CCA74969.1} [Serendipita indica DSM 11827]CCA74969.1 hypothetical protein PIIN_08949 [Serendipita indica DSM 11827]